MRQVKTLTPRCYSTPTSPFSERTNRLTEPTPTRFVKNMLGCRSRTIGWEGGTSLSAFWRGRGFFASWPSWKNRLAGTFPPRALDWQVFDGQRICVAVNCQLPSFLRKPKSCTTFSLLEGDRGVQTVWTAACKCRVVRAGTAIRRKRQRTPVRPGSHPDPVHLRKTDQSKSGNARREYPLVVLS